MHVAQGMIVLAVLYQDYRRSFQYCRQLTAAKWLSSFNTPLPQGSTDAMLQLCDDYYKHSNSESLSTTQVQGSIHCCTMLWKAATETWSSCCWTMA